MTVIFGIDAGATRTRIQIDVPDAVPIRREIGTTSRAAVGHATAERRLRRIFDMVAEAASGRTTVGWVASASIVADTAQEELAVLRGVMPPHCRLLVASNDSVPLLIAPPLSDRGVVLLAGTGTGFLGGDGHTVLHLGNHDYLGSDEGSAFEIGLQALRAALRGRDGFGPRSSLETALATQCGNDIAAEARRLARLPFPKQAVARLAPVVLKCWLDGDRMAASVVDAAVESLAAHAVSVRNRLQLPPSCGTVLAGGLVTDCPSFAAAVRTAMEVRAGPHDITICSDPAATILSCARRLVTSHGRHILSDAYLDKHVWVLSGDR